MTVDEVIAALIANTGRGSPKRSFEVMTPSRYSHAIELLQQGVPSAVVVDAVNRINASSWLRRPIAEIGQAEVDEALRLADERGMLRERCGVREVLHHPGDEQGRSQSRQSHPDPRERP